MVNAQVTVHWPLSGGRQIPLSQELFPVSFSCQQAEGFNAYFFVGREKKKQSHLAFHFDGTLCATVLFHYKVRITK